MLNIEQSTLRYWEKFFPKISPQRSNGNHRLYTSEEIEQIKLVSHLLKDRGLKIESAQKLLEKNYDEVRRAQIITNKLKKIKDEINSLKKEFRNSVKIIDTPQKSTDNIE